MKAWDGQSSKIMWFLTIAAITAGVYLGFRYLLPLVLPFMFAYFLSWIIRPVTESLYRKFKIPRVVGGSFSLLLLIAVFGTAFCLLVNIIIKQAFAFLKNTPVYLNVIADKLDSICSYCDRFMGYDGGTIRGIVDDNLTNGLKRIQSNIMPKLTEHTISLTLGIIAFFGISLIVLVAAVLITKDLPEFHKRFEQNRYYQDIHKITTKLTEAGLAYMRSQLIIMVLVAGICVFALILIHNEYAVLIGIGIGVMDALPILGSGIVLLPWAVIMLMDGRIYAAAILVTAYLLSQVIREILEPKLIGNRIGIKPIFTLISMYVGVKLFSVIGFILGPIGLVIIMTIYHTIYGNDEKEHMT